MGTATDIEQTNLTEYQLGQLVQLLKQLDEKVDRLTADLEGNGKEGLGMRVDRIEQWRAGISRTLTILQAIILTEAIGLVLGLLTGRIVLTFR